MGALDSAEIPSEFGEPQKPPPARVHDLCAGYEFSYGWVPFSLSPLSWARDGWVGVDSEIPSPQLFVSYVCVILRPGGWSSLVGMMVSAGGSTANFALCHHRNFARCVADDGFPVTPGW